MPVTSPATLIGEFGAQVANRHPDLRVSLTPRSATVTYPNRRHLHIMVSHGGQVVYRTLSESGVVLRRRDADVPAGGIEPAEFYRDAMAWSHQPGGPQD